MISPAGSTGLGSSSTARSRGAGEVASRAAFVFVARFISFSWAAFCCAMVGPRLIRFSFTFFLPLSGCEIWRRDWRAVRAASTMFEQFLRHASAVSASVMSLRQMMPRSVERPSNAFIVKARASEGVGEVVSVMIESR